MVKIDGNWISYHTERTTSNWLFNLYFARILFNFGIAVYVWLPTVLSESPLALAKTPSEVIFAQVGLG